MTVPAGRGGGRGKQRAGNPSNAQGHGSWGWAKEREGVEEGEGGDEARRRRRGLKTGPSYKSSQRVKR